MAGITQHVIFETIGRPFDSATARIAGSSKSEAKVAAARANGARGGRPPEWNFDPRRVNRMLVEEHQRRGLSLPETPGDKVPPALVDAVAKRLGCSIRTLNRRLVMWQAQSESLGTQD